MDLATLILETTGVTRTFYFRPGSSDEGVIKQVFQQQQYALHRFKRWPDLVNLLAANAAHHCRPLVIDGGANIGASAVYFATKFPRCKVIAIEPVRHNLDILLKNVEGLDVQAREAALASKAGRSTIVDAGIGFWGFRTQPLSHGAEVGVPNVTVGEIYRAHQSGFFPFLVKIDIEGAEGELFSANTDWVKETPVIVIELHDWLLPRRNTAAPFLRTISKYDRDFVSFGENIVSIANDLRRQ